jgi:hypothetical protein
MPTKSSHLAARLLLAIVLLAAMFDCQGTAQYRYCTEGACVPAKVPATGPGFGLRAKLRPCVFLYRGYCTVYWFAPHLQTREKHKATHGEAAGVYTGVPGERRLPLGS